MSDVVHQGTLFHRGDTAGWQEYSGQLMETGELRLVGQDGATVHSFMIAKDSRLRKGSEFDGPQPNKNNTKFIIFIKSGKNFLEIAAGSDEAANEWIAQAKAFAGSKGFLGFKSSKADRPRSKSATGSPSALSTVGNAASSAAGAVGGLAAKVWKKSTKVIVGGKDKDGEESDPGSPSIKERSDKSDSPKLTRGEGSSPSLNISVTKKSHHRRSSSVASSNTLSQSEDDSSNPAITATNDPQVTRGGLVANIPLPPGVPAPMTPIKLNITPPTYKGFNFEAVSMADVAENSESDDDRAEDYRVLSARFRKHRGLPSEESNSPATKSRKKHRSESLDNSEDSNDEDKKSATESSSSSTARKVDQSKNENDENKEENENTPKKDSHQDKEREQRRARIVNEVMTTEQSYVKSLSNAILFYLDPMLAKASEIGEEPEKINKIFGNLRMILQFNENFLVAIQKCVSDWTPDTLFGPIFLRLAPFLKMYTSYSNKYEDAVSTYQSMIKKNEKFANLVKEQQGLSGLNLGLFDLLIQPIQRIPRYSLLLKDLIKNTPEDHPDMPNLRSALTIIEEVAQHINEEVRRAENNRRVEEMAQKGINIASLIAPHRFLLKEGLVRIEVAPSPAQLLAKPDAKSKSDTYHLFLFNDVFVHVKKSDAKTDVDLTSSIYCCPLTLCWISIDSGRKVLLKQPWEHIIFSDEGGWHATIADAIKNYIQHENENDRNANKCDLSVRFGTFDYPGNNGVYKGRFVDGRREGKGLLVSYQSSYRGEFKNDRFDGKGRYDYFNGDHYVGQWSEGLMHGRGRYVRADGSVYEGEWHKGMRKGFGRQTYANGDVIEAKWKNDRIANEGRMICANGLKYEGEWKDNRFDGLGSLVLPSGATYEGEFKEGMKHGKGTFTYPDGHQYVGEFKDDLVPLSPHDPLDQFDYELTSTYSHKDRGLIYEGSWEFDRYHGQGTRTYPNGSHYTGGFNMGERVGKGSCVYPNGGIYLGTWEEDRPHGEGIYADKEGFVYQGSWVRGKREPKGQCWFKNGAYYVGHFNNGYFFKGGQYYGGSDEYVASYDGDWNNGRMHGKGVITFKNGDSYKGQFHLGSIHGEGVYTFANGTSVSGTFTHQQLNGAFIASVGDKAVLQGQVVGNLLHRAGSMAFNLPASSPFLNIPYPDIEVLRTLEQ